jgi:hypothetical protein
LDLNDCLAANALYFSAADAVVLALLDPLKISGNHLKLQGRASRVQHQNIHHTVFML